MKLNDFVQCVAIYLADYLADPLTSDEGVHFVATCRYVTNTFDLSADSVLETIVDEIQSSALEEETIAKIEDYYERINDYMEIGESELVFKEGIYTDVARFYAEVFARIRALSVIEGRLDVEEGLWGLLGSGLIANPHKMVRCLNIVIYQYDISVKYELPQPNDLVKQYMGQRRRCLAPAVALGR